MRATFVCLLVCVTGIGTGEGMRTLNIQNKSQNPVTVYIMRNDGELFRKVGSDEFDVQPTLTLPGNHIEMFVAKENWSGDFIIKNDAADVSPFISLTINFKSDEYTMYSKFTKGVVAHKFSFFPCSDTGFQLADNPVCKHMVCPPLGMPYEKVGQCEAGINHFQLDVFQI